MLAVKNNSLSFRWELKFIFMQVLKNEIDHQHGRLFTCLKTKNNYAFLSRKTLLKTAVWQIL